MTAHPMRRATAPVAALLLLLTPVAASAQPRPMPMPEPSQLDRIERHLGEVLRRLDALEAAGRAAPSPRSEATPASPVEYRPGALVVLRPAPVADALLTPPADSLANTIHAGGPLRLYGPGTGGRPGEPAGVELQGWLRAREAGRHQLFADFSFARAGAGMAWAPCAAVLWVEERRAGAASGELGIGLGRPGSLSLTLGADLAAPGLYRVLDDWGHGKLLKLAKASKGKASALLSQCHFLCCACGAPPVSTGQLAQP